MNQRFVLENGDKEKFTCVLAPERDAQEQWEKIFAIQKGCGFSVDRWKDRVDIVDYFHGETRATFRILSVEATEDKATEALKKLD